MTDRIRVTVRKVREGSDVTPGESKELVAPATIGRGTDSDFVLDDETVSHTHAEFENGPHGPQLHNRSSRGATFVNGRRLSSGERVRIGDARATLQIGGVLLLLQPVATTREFETNLDDDERAIVRIDRVAAKYVIRVTGTQLHFSSRPAGAFARLAATPGATVSHTDLLNAADPTYGGGNPNQLITYVRTVIRDSIQSGEVDERALSDAVRESLGTGANTTWTTRALLTKMFENVRGANYRLNVPAGAVVITRS